eukprot:TRINITY_DN1901_c0_g1_i1.p1 TRINITY_DN1901_c0_g1~~TRINITY_DN1901_c0_g1_i1.p1  ORF type:complete len:135 (-),score=51.56 TRINITY_DN1901_c0_g1_i1:46-450(-)
MKYLCQCFMKYVSTQTSGDAGDKGQWYFRAGEFGMINNKEICRFPSRGYIPMRKDSDLVLDPHVLMYSSVLKEGDDFKFTFKTVEYDLLNNDELIEEDIKIKVEATKNHPLTVTSKNGKVKVELYIRMDAHNHW